MMGHQRGLPHKLHGLQVGIGILVTSALYARVRAMNPAEFDLDQLEKKYLGIEQEAGRIRQVYGPISDEVMKQFEMKYMPWRQKREELQLVLDNWNRIWDKLGPILLPTESIRSTLQTIGAPTNAPDLGWSNDELRNAYRWARYMRSRYTILDLAADLGVLEDTSEEVLQEAGVLK